MYLIFSASADNYITNKIISTSLSASDANVGQASTLDLFKIYDETTFTGYTGSYSAPTEISRLLVKFDLTSVSSSIASFAELDNFKAYLSLKDINGSQIAPKKFNVAVYPLSKSWDEGRGSDIYSFNDLDQSNWMTASYSDSSYVLWDGQGATSIGYLGSSDIDIIGSGSVGGSQINFVGTQYFTEGHEDLMVDVTNVVSATLGGFVQDKGFLIAFSGSEETDTKTRFVKRFASRHARNEYLRPSLIVKIDDSINDQREEMYFNTSGSLFLENKVRGAFSNIKSGSNTSELTGNSCMSVIFHTGTFALTASAGQYAPAGLSKTGLYRCRVAFNEFTGSTVHKIASASATITVGGNPADDEEFTLIDYSGKKQVFIFKDDSTTFDGTYADPAASKKVSVGFQNRSGSAAEIAHVITTAINGADGDSGYGNISISATSSSATITLTQDLAGGSGNTLTTFSVTNVTGSHFSGGTTSFADETATSGSLVIYERWMDSNEVYTYYTGSFTVNADDISSSANKPRYKITVTNLATEYKKNEIHRLDLHVRDDNKIHKPVRRNFGLASLKFQEAYYSIRDTRTGNVIVPFTKTSNATRISSDSDGMYFKMSTKNWPKGRSYTIDILVVQDGNESIYETGLKFKVV